MRKPAIIAAMALLTFFTTTCKNAVATSEKTPTQANTAHLKDTSLAFNENLLAEHSQEVLAFYKANNNKTVWIKPEDRKAIIAAVADAGSDGLLPEEYNLHYLQNFESLKSVSKEDCMRYDLMLTESVSKLCSHLFKGKLKPSQVYHDWALAPKKFDANKLLSEAIEKHNIPEIINRCRPRHATYEALRNSLSYINSLPEDNIPAIAFTKDITLNDSAASVGIIKQRLVYWGDLDKESATGNVFDKTTQNAVKKFQVRHGLSTTGKVDKATAETLNVTRQQRREQLIANLERWRWFPYDFGERAVVVNIPTFSMCVLENGKDTLQTYRVVVGKPDRRSPVLHSVLNNLVINPTWTVPPTYLKKDLVPAALKDTAHFAHLNMKIMYKGEEIPVSEWDAEKADHYVYVQSPGDHNSLGRIKFNFQNGFYVYLHDTNHKEYFRKGYRALSSGCVRIENPFKLAGYVLENENAGWTSDAVQEMVASNETQSIGLKKTIHVHQLYWTAWMDKDGLQFRPDIYKLDKILYNKLSGKS
ncbi:L,D-transpeptidase family protein [Flavobacterium akiainvivens]|uniref:L,D-transpeptidase family protein n=1 Tax=Flavobacterium akiainvivens TaxID=1202724 RepID=UPI0006C8776F|nr:L,D-transpeptidase family protein [Flavobacterium akiainvivens]SFQ10482.1 Murein L,D-transpeptidase YcbB/YkuD [Flavobacterium akiainvivens]